MEKDIVPKKTNKKTKSKNSNKSLITHKKSSDEINTNNTRIDSVTANSTAHSPDEAHRETKLTIMYTNADQFTNSKREELLVNISKARPDIIAICEMRPKNGKERTEIDYKIPEFNMHSVNVLSGTGRGIAIYTHSSHEHIVEEISVENGYNEACLLKIQLHNQDQLLFGCIYRSPSSNDTSHLNDERLNELISVLCNRKYSHICLVGDFNLKDINWKTWSTPKNEHSKEHKFLETLRDCYLFQHVTEPTRARGTDEPSLLDLIITNEEMQVSDIQFTSPLGKSDHSVIYFNYNCYLDVAKHRHESFSYNKADYEAMRQYLTDLDWRTQFLKESDSLSVEDHWLTLKRMLVSVRNKFVPKVCQHDWRRKGKIPVSKDLRNAIRSKNAAHRNWILKKNRVDGDHARMEFKRKRNKVKTLLRKAKRDFEQNIASKIKSNPKSFWSHVRQKLKSKSGIAPLLQDPKDKSSTKFNDKEKADILQNQYSSVFTIEPCQDLPSLDRRTNNRIPEIEIDKVMVENEINKLNVNKSMGPDEIHPRLLKELVAFVAEPLSCLFNKTINQGCIPRDWKIAHVSAIYKKGPKNLAVNYRPISLTSIVCKLMESLVKQSLVAYLKSENLLSSKQFGFINGRSTATQLLCYLDKCINTIVSGGVVDAIYFDFSKAFDTVPHQRLLKKLTSYGIDGKVHGWIKAFLENREQVVMVNGQKSYPVKVLSGIPQGSVLGPILFVLYINDLPDSVLSDILLFADDTKIFRPVRNKEDATGIQNDIIRLQDWSNKWLLKFNIDKCHVLTLGKFEDIRYTQRYKLDGEELEHVFDEKDLGVTLDSELKFRDHMNIKINKANSMAGLIRRSFDYLDGPLFRQLFTTLVRPHLEYCQSVWSPHLQKDINAIESVQRRATKLVNGMNGLDYPERLEKLNLPTLAFRRRRGDMIELYKHFHVYDNATLPATFLPRTKAKRKHEFQLERMFPKDGVRGIQYNSFYYRSIEVWNNLPRNVVNAESINDFKNKLDAHWTDHPLKFNHEANKSDS